MMRRTQRIPLGEQLNPKRGRRRRRRKQKRSPLWILRQETNMRFFYDECFRILLTCAFNLKPSCVCCITDTEPSSCSRCSDQNSGASCASLRFKNHQRTVLSAWVSSVQSQRGAQGQKFKQKILFVFSEWQFVCLLFCSQRSLRSPWSLWNPLRRKRLEGKLELTFQVYTKLMQMIVLKLARAIITRYRFCPRCITSPPLRRQNESELLG